MTWAPGPIGEDSPAELYAVVRELAARSVDMLESVAARTVTYGEPDEPIWAQDAADLRGLRQELIDTCHLQLQLLSRSDVEELRRGFDLARLGGDENATKRKEVTEKVVGHPVVRLAELTTEERDQLNHCLRELEEKF